MNGFTIQLCSISDENDPQTESQTVNLQGFLEILWKKYKGKEDIVRR